jgi:hypothetical protein
MDAKEVPASPIEHGIVKDSNGSLNIILIS